MTTTTEETQDTMIGAPTNGVAGYRRIRATTVLAKASKRFGDADPGLLKAITKLEKHNYDVGRLRQKDVEMFYAYFDRETSEEITSEFRFVSEHGACQYHPSKDAFCDLCGKGDSRDDGENEDMLNYTFKLTNKAGGQDIWVGSSCILQHHLHVDGAATSEEAKRILNSTLNAHKKEWEIDAWRLEHEDHETIPRLYSDLNSFRLYHLSGQELWALNVEIGQLRHRVRAVTKSFRTASKFYARKAFLSPKKTTDWQRAKVALRELRWYEEIISESRRKFPAERTARHDWLADQASERKAARRKELRRAAAEQG
jgi:hypothetical protein